MASVMPNKPRRGRRGPGNTTRSWANGMYPSLPVLDCEGPSFSNIWREFREAVARNWAKGFPENTWLYGLAAELTNTWKPLLEAGSTKHVRILMRKDPVWKLNGFCLYGFATALFIAFRHSPTLELANHIKGVLGWVEWPLDFMESSAWPPLWRIFPLHLEQAELRGGDMSWSLDYDSWADDMHLLPVPQIIDFEAIMAKWTAQAALRQTLPFRLVEERHSTMQNLRLELASLKRCIRVRVYGHHTGSSLEPFTMLSRALNLEGATCVEARFTGQHHPGPKLLCEELGFCDRNVEMEAWFERYESSQKLHGYTWMRDGNWSRVASELFQLLGRDLFFLSADATVCGGPFWVCTMVRSFRRAPMLLYFAWAAVPMVPTSSTEFLLRQFQSFSLDATTPTVLLCANRVLQVQFAVQARVLVPVVRPHGLYANATYNPLDRIGQKQQVVVTRVGHWARTSGVALLEVVSSFLEAAPDYPFEFLFLSVRKKGYSKESMKPVSYEKFAQYYATVFWPWDVMMLLFDELYTMTMPLIVPAKRWMYSLMHHALTQTDMNWWHLRANMVRATLPFSPQPDEYPFPFLPWISPQGHLEECAYWYELTDFARFPHLAYFNSLPEMFHAVQVLDVETVRAGMRHYNLQTLQASDAFYRAAAAWLLSGGLQS